MCVMNKITIEQIPIETGSSVIDWVLRLFSELGEEMDDLGSLNEEKVLADWRTSHDRFYVFAAKDEHCDVIGMLTLAESFAIYANGSYGIINEMYVSPAHRGVGVGAMLLNAAKEFGMQKDWARIEVTAPESSRWQRSQRFYEKHGFVFTGPKLKFRLGANL